MVGACVHCLIILHIVVNTDQNQIVSPLLGHSFDCKHGLEGTIIIAITARPPNDTSILFYHDVMQCDVLCHAPL